MTAGRTSAPLSARRILAALERLAMVSVVVAAGIVAFHRLGSGPCAARPPGGSPVTVWMRLGLCGSDVCGANEAIEAIFVQQMVEHGEVAFPLENGIQPMYKPPLFHWSAFVLDRLIGVRKVNAFNLRAVAAIYALLGLALTIGFAESRFEGETAIVAGLILVSSYQYMNLARVGRVDMTLCFFEALALLAFLRWLDPVGVPAPTAAMPARKSRVAHYLLALALGLAMLAKGPVGAILPLAAIALFLFLDRRRAEARELLRPGPVALALTVGLSWYAMCLAGRRYGFLSRQLGAENFGRFFGTLGAMPPWYYLKPLLLNSLPASLVVPIAVFWALSLKRVTGAGEGVVGAAAAASESGSAGSDSAARFATPSHEQRNAVRLLALFWVATVLFFSIAAYKRRAYLLPLWPASALLAAAWLEGKKASLAGRILRGMFAVACVVAIVFNFFYLPWRESHDCRLDSFRPAAAQLRSVLGPGDRLYAYGFRNSLAPLVFYLDRNVTRLHGKLDVVPDGYVLMPARLWRTHRGEEPDLRPVMRVPWRREGLVLLRSIPAYAGRLPRRAASRFPGMKSAPYAARPAALSVPTSAVRSASP